MLTVNVLSLYNSIGGSSTAAAGTAAADDQT